MGRFLTRRSFFVHSAGASACLLMSGVARRALEGEQREKEQGTLVPTLKGSVSCQKLGMTLIHEHVIYGTTPPEKRTETIEFAAKLLNDAARVGIDTIVDLSPYRDIRLCQEIAQHTPVNIILSTGFYLYSRTPKLLRGMSEQQMEKHMSREVTEGVEGTKIRAGILKVSGEKSPLTDWEKAAFRAAARVQKATRTPIGTHAIFEPREQFDVLTKSGADPNRIFLSHTEAEFGWKGKNVKQMAEYLLSIGREGGSMLFNNFGFEFDTPWPDLVYLIRYLCDKGYSNRVLISIDCNWEWKNGRIVFEAAEAHPETAKRTYSYMITDAVPALLEAGFSAKEIHIFLVDNPRRFFSKT
jgi:phosphotriesterase-related protein